MQQNQLIRLARYIWPHWRPLNAAPFNPAYDVSNPATYRDITSEAELWTSYTGVFTNSNAGHIPNPNAGGFTNSNTGHIPNPNAGNISRYRSANGNNCWSAYAHIQSI